MSSAGVSFLALSLKIHADVIGGRTETDLNECS